MSDMSKPVSTKNSLHDLLKSRLEDAKKWTTENFIDDSEKSLKDYNFARDYSEFQVSDTDKLMYAANRRYNQVLPVIFSFTEALKAAVFDRHFSVIIKKRGKDDSEKEKTIKAAHQYLVDKLKLYKFQEDAFEIFALLGHVSAHVGFKNEYYEEPYINELTGEPELDENGQPIMIPVYTYNDPVVDLNKYNKTFYSPDSEFLGNDGEGIPYYFVQMEMTKEQVMKLYKKEVEPDIEMEGSEDKDGKNKKCGIYYYIGTIPDEYKGKVKNWSPDKKYYIVMNSKTILAKGDVSNNCAVGKYFGTSTSFFGFGFGKVGRYFQLEKSIRRGQQTRLMDLAAYPKWFIKNDGQNHNDLRALADPRALPYVTYKEVKPELSDAPQINQGVIQLEEAAARDAQQAFGVLDIVGGGQDSSTTPDTATGQSIFADAVNKRIKMAKEKFGAFYLQVVINLLKEAQANWDESKMVEITDDDGNLEELELTKESLANIDFDKDLQIELETATSNKDLMKSQNIELYNTMKDDPLVNRAELIKKLMRENYGIDDPEKFLTNPEMQPGKTFTDEMGQLYVVDDTGQLVPQQAEATTAEPTESAQAPSNTGSLLGASQNVEV